MDRDVTFKEQVSNVCRKAGLQLSVSKRLSFILNTNVKMAALHTFIKSYLQYCPLVWANQSKRGDEFLRTTVREGSEICLQ